MTLRLVFAFGVACLVTLGLFWIMQALVSVQGTLQEGRGKLAIEFVRLRKDTPPETKERTPPKREKPEEPPPPPDIHMSQSNLDPGQAVAAIVPEIDVGKALTAGIAAGGGADRDVVPLVRIEPDYPISARQRGLEGWVLVEFTINKVGSVQDVVVLASEPGTVFDRAAVQAVKKWKYNPRIEGGAAVERRGVRTTLEFTMED